MSNRTLFDLSIARGQSLFLDASFNPEFYPDDAQPTIGTRHEFDEDSGFLTDPELQSSLREDHGGDTEFWEEQGRYRGVPVVNRRKRRRLEKVLGKIRGDDEEE